MDIKIIEEKNNPLLNRREVVFKVDHESAILPGRASSNNRRHNELQGRLGGH